MKETTYGDLNCVHKVYFYLAYYRFNIIHINSNKLCCRYVENFQYVSNNK